MANEFISDEVLLEQIRLNNPNSVASNTDRKKTELDQKLKEDFISEQTRRKLERTAQRGRDLGTHLQDAALSFAEIGPTTAEIPLAIAERFQRPTEGRERRSFAHVPESQRTAIQEAITQRDNLRLAEETAEHADFMENFEITEGLKETLRENKSSVLQAKISLRDMELAGISESDLGTADALAEAVKVSLANPSATVDTILQSGGIFLVSGVGKKALVKAFGKDIATDKVKLSVATKVKGSQLTKAEANALRLDSLALEDRLASLAGIGTTIAFETSGNANAAFQQALKMTPEQWAKSEPYQEAKQRLLNAGMDEEAAHRGAALEIAGQIKDTVALNTAFIAGITSYVTGAGKFEADVGAEALGGFAKGAKELGKGVVKEAVEETVQSGGGTVAENIATQKFVDPDQELITPEVGAQAGVGLVAGAGSPVVVTPAIAGAVAAGKTGITAGKLIAGGAKAVKDRGAQQIATDIAEAIEAGKAKAKEVKDIAADSVAVQKAIESGSPEGLDPVNTLSYIFETAPGTDATPEQIEEHQQAVIGQLRLMKQVADELEPGTPEYNRLAKATEKGLEIWRNTRDRIIDGANPKDIVEEIREAEELDDSTDVLTQLINREFGSKKRTPEEVTKALLESDHVSDADKERIRLRIEKEKAGSIEETGRDILGGGSKEGRRKGFTGLIERLKNIQRNVDLNRPDEAQRHLNNLGRFAAQHTRKAQILRDRLKKVIPLEEGLKKALADNDTETADKITQQLADFHATTRALSATQDKPQGFTIHGSSANFVETVESEAEYLQLSYQDALQNTLRPAFGERVQDVFNSFEGQEVTNELDTATIPTGTSRQNNVEVSGNVQQDVSPVVSESVGDTNQPAGNTDQQLNLPSTVTTDPVGFWEEVDSIRTAQNVTEEAAVELTLAQGIWGNTAPARPTETQVKKAKEPKKPISRKEVLIKDLNELYRKRNVFRRGTQAQKRAVGKITKQIEGVKSKLRKLGMTDAEINSAAVVARKPTQKRAPKKQSTPKELPKVKRLLSAAKANVTRLRKTVGSQVEQAVASGVTDEQVLKGIENQVKDAESVVEFWDMAVKFFTPRISEFINELDQKFNNPIQELENQLKELNQELRAGPATATTSEGIAQFEANINTRKQDIYTKLDDIRAAKFAYTVDFGDKYLADVKAASEAEGDTQRALESAIAQEEAESNIADIENRIAKFEERNDNEDLSLADLQEWRTLINQRDAYNATLDGGVNNVTEEDVNEEAAVPQEGDEVVVGSNTPEPDNSHILVVPTPSTKEQAITEVRRYFTNALMTSLPIDSWQAYHNMVNTLADEVLEMVNAERVKTGSTGNDAKLNAHINKVMEHRSQGFQNAVNDNPLEDNRSVSYKQGHNTAVEMGLEGAAVDIERTHEQKATYVNTEMALGFTAARTGKSLPDNASIVAKIAYKGIQDILTATTFKDKETAIEGLIAGATKGRSAYGTQGLYDQFVTTGLSLRAAANTNVFNNQDISEEAVNTAKTIAALMENTSVLARRIIAKARTFQFAGHISQFMVPKKIGKKVNIFDKYEGVMNTLKAKASNPDLETDITEINNLTAKQTGGLPNLVEFVDEFVNAFNRVEPKRKNFELEDFIEYLREDQGKPLDREAVEAIAVAAYEWMVSSASGTFLNDTRAINMMLQRPKDAAPIPGWNSPHRKLSRAGKLLTSTADSMGASAVNNLGMTELSETSENFGSNIRSSVGQAMITALQDMDLITINYVPNEQFNEWLGPNASTLKEKDTVVNFVRVKTIKGEKVYEEEISPKAQAITDAAKENDNLLSKLFGYKEKGRGINFEKPVQTSKKIKGQNQKLARKFQEAVNHYSSLKFRTKKDNIRLWNMLDLETKRDLLGYVRDWDNIRRTDHHGLVGKNRQIDANIENIDLFEAKRLEEMLRQEVPDPYFYFEHFAPSNNRIHMLSDTVNPQSSKVDRFLYAPENQAFEVNEGNFPLFLFGLSQAFDIKLEKVWNDYEGDDASKLNQIILDKVYGNEVTEPAIKAIQAMKANPSMRGTELDKHKAALKAAVLEFGEGMHTFDGLTNLARADVKSMLEGGPITTFEADISAEIDGTNNGVVLSTLLFAAANSRTNINLKDPEAVEQALQEMRFALNKGGFFWGDGLDAENMHQWLTQPNKLAGFNLPVGAANQDNYVSLASTWLGSGAFERIRNEYLNKNAKLNRTKFARAQSFVGEDFIKAMRKDISSKVRNLIKEALIPINYGANVNTAVNNVVDSMVNNIYTQITEARNDQDKLNSIARSLNDMTVAFDRNGEKIKVKEIVLTPENALTFEFDRTQSEIITKIYMATYGKALREAIDETFAPLAAMRNQVNDSVEANFLAFRMMYQREVAVARNKKNGDALSSTEREAILEKLLDISPIFKHALSESADHTDSLSMVNTTKSRDYSPAYRQSATRKPFTVKQLTPMDRATREAFNSWEDNLQALYDLGSNDNRDLAPEDLDTKKAFGAEYKKLVDYYDGNLEKAYTDFRRGIRVRSTMTMHTLAEILESPGLSSAVLGIQSTDSAIMQPVQQAIMALAVHDAVVTNPVEAVKAGEALNIQTLDITKNFSLQSEVLTSLKRAVEFLRVQDNFEGSTTSNIAALNAELQSYQNIKRGSREGNAPINFSIDDMINDLEKETEITDFLKKAFLERTKFVDQYAGIGFAGFTTATDTGITPVPFEQREQEVKEAVASADLEGEQEEALGKKLGQSAAKQEAVVLADMADRKRILAGGFVPNITLKEQAKQYRGPNGRKFKIGDTVYISVREYLGPNKYQAAAGLLLGKTESKWYVFDPITGEQFFEGNSRDDLIGKGLHFWVKGTFTQKQDIYTARAQYALDNNNIEDLVILLEHIARVYKLPVTASKELKKVYKNRENLSGYGKYESEQRFSSSVDSEDINTRTFRRTVMEEVFRRVNPDNIRQVFNSLGSDKRLNKIKVSEAHRAHLNNVLENILEKVIPELTLKIRESKAISSGVLSGDTVYMNVNNTRTVDSNEMSSQEILVHELMHAALRRVLEDTTDEAFYVTQRLQKLYDAASKVFAEDGSDFLNYNADGSIRVPSGSTVEIEKQRAKDKYDHIFGSGELHEVTGETRVGKYKDTRSAYLHEFAVMASTNEKFRNLLIDKNVSIKGKEFDSVNPIDIIATLISKAWNYLANKIAGVEQGTNAAEEVDQLILEVTGLANRNQGKVLLAADYAATLTGDAMQKFIVAPANKALQAVAPDSAPGSPLPTDTLGQEVQLLTRRVGHLTKEVINVLPTEKMTRYAQIAQRIRDRMSHTEGGLISSIGNELTGRTAITGVYHDLIAKAKHLVEQNAAKASDTMSKLLLAHYKTEPTKEQKEAITQMLLMTDLSSIADKHMVDGTLRKLLTNDDAFRSQEIKRVEKEIREAVQAGNASSSNYHHYIYMAESLAHDMILGLTLEENSKKNAFNIVNMSGTKNTRKVVGDTQLLEELVDELVTLNAIGLVQDQQRSDFLEVFDQEFEDGKEFVTDAQGDKKYIRDNGLTATLRAHKDIKARVLRDQFDGQKGLITKGFHSEITHPDISYAVAPLEDEKRMADRGYKIVHMKDGKPQPIGRDKNDPLAVDMYFYVSYGDTLNRWQSTIVQFVSDKAKGTSIAELHSQTGADYPGMRALQDIPTLKASKAQALEDTFLPRNKRKTASEATNKLVPITDNAGNVVDYRYQMAEETRAHVLEKDYDFSAIMGQMESTYISKTNAKPINLELVDTAYADYSKYGASNPNGFVWIGATSEDPKLKELYFMLPDYMRAHVFERWGDRGMWIRKNQAATIFGQRKISFSNQNYETDPFKVADMKLYEKILNEFKKYTNNPTVRKVEKGIEELGGAVKDAIVIKSGVVLYGNIVSNNWLLWTKGVSISRILKDQLIGIKSAMDYQKTLAEINSLELEVKLGTKQGRSQATKNKIVRLKDQLARNRIHSLVEAGVFQTIIEDIDVEDERRFTFANKVDEKLFNPIREKSALVADATDVLLMRHNTRMYQFMRTATQLSDFVARYALHQHNIRSGFTEQESIGDIVETFVNYDLPTHPGIQYANDMMISMFTKFQIRIQKVILQQATQSERSQLVKQIARLEHEAGILEKKPTATDKEKGENAKKLKTARKRMSELESRLGTARSTPVGINKMIGLGAVEGIMGETSNITDSGLLWNWFNFSTPLHQPLDTEFFPVVAQMQDLALDLSK